MAVERQVARAIPDRKSLAERRGQNLVPVNEHLWTLVQHQARYRFAQFPSPAASAWMHKRYTDMGGRFRDTHNEEDAKVAHKIKEKRSAKEKKADKELEEQEKQASKTRVKVKAPHRRERKKV